MDPTLGIILIVVLVVVLGVVAVPLFKRRDGERPAVEEEEPPVRYRVTLFSGGDKVRTFEVDDFDWGDGEAVLLRDDNDHQLILIGTYVIEPILLRPASDDRYRQNGDEDRFKITLYDQGKVVGEWTANDFESTNGQVRFYQPDCEEGFLASGTIVIEQIG